MAKSRYRAGLVSQVMVELSDRAVQTAATLDTLSPSPAGGG